MSGSNCFYYYSSVKPLGLWIYSIVIFWSLVFVFVWQLGWIRWTFVWFRLERNVKGCHSFWDSLPRNKQLSKWSPVLQSIKGGRIILAQYSISNVLKVCRVTICDLLELAHKWVYLLYYFSFLHSSPFHKVILI